METRILHFEKAGRGPALFFLHGFLGNLDNWRTLGKRFTEDFTVYWVDARNHGKSFWAPSMTYAEQAQDIIRLLEKEKLQEAFFVGHSMGGKTVMQLMQSSDKVAGAVILDIAPRKYSQGHEKILEALASVPLNEFTKREEVDRWLQSFIPELSIRQFLLKGLTRDAEGKFAWVFNLPVLRAQYSQVTKAVGAKVSFSPVRFLRGEKSDYIQQEDIKEIKKLFPRAEVVEIAGAGHWVHVDNPEATCQAIRTFLDSLRARRDSNPQPPDP